MFFFKKLGNDSFLVFLILVVMDKLWTWIFEKYVFYVLVRERKKEGNFKCNNI